MIDREGDPVKSIRNKFVLLMIGCVLICSLAIGIISVLGVDSISKEDAETIMQLQASTSTESIDRLFSTVELAMSACYDYAFSRFHSISEFQNDPDRLIDYNDSVGQLIKNVMSNTEASICGYIRYNPDLNLSSDGVFWVKDSNSNNIKEHELTDIEKYKKEDSEHVAWYYEPLKAGKPVWIDPYVNKNLDNVI